jgi:hypothetical protein
MRVIVKDESEAAAASCEIGEWTLPAVYEKFATVGE